MFLCISWLQISLDYNHVISTLLYYLSDRYIKVLSLFREKHNILVSQWKKI